MYNSAETDEYSDDKLSYVQSFYPVANRPQSPGAMVTLIKPTEYKEISRKILLQLLAQPDHNNINVSDYKKYKTINMESMGDAIDTILGVERTEENFRENYNKIQNSSELQDRIIEQFIKNLEEESKVYVNRLSTMKFGDNLKTVANKLASYKYITKEEKEQTANLPYSYRDAIHTNEQIEPLVKLWFINNYINGYFLNQIAVGNFNAFSSAEVLEKRMSTVFAPGIKPLTDKEFFSNTEFNIAISTDPIITREELSDVIQEIPELKEQYPDTIDIADSASFILPETAFDISKGLSDNYRFNKVFKASVYAQRKVVDSETKEEHYIPFIKKDAEIVLTDELVNKFPKLLKMRDEMRRTFNGKLKVDVLTFNSSSKVARPEPVEGINKSIPNVNSDFSESFELNNEYIVQIDREDYRVQLNPDSDTAIPTTLSNQYVSLINTLAQQGLANNTEWTAEIYSAIAFLTEKGFNTFKQKYVSNGKLDI